MTAMREQALLRGATGVRDRHAACVGRQPGPVIGAQNGGTHTGTVLILCGARAPPRMNSRIYLTAARLKRVTEFVQTHLADDIGLGALAAAAELSPFHFSRVFKLTTGEAPYRYVRSRRLERARMLLETTLTPLSEIALACGFANQSHFTAAFTQATGLSPGRHRRRTSQAPVADPREAA